MESALLGLVLDSSVLIAAERKRLTTSEAIKKVRETAGDVPIVVCSMSVAELGHGIYRERSRMRRQFLDELTAEIIARVGAEQAANGITLPLADLIIGACALELGDAIGASNVRDFSRVPGLNLIRL